MGDIASSREERNDSANVAVLHVSNTTSSSSLARGLDLVGLLLTQNGVNDILILIVSFL